MNHHHVCKHCHKTIRTVRDIRDCKTCQSAHRTVEPHHDDDSIITSTMLGVMLGASFQNTMNSVEMSPVVSPVEPGGGEFGGGGASGSWDDSSSSSSDGFSSGSSD